jgi:hypothetical protein
LFDKVIKSGFLMIYGFSHSKIIYTEKIKKEFARMLLLLYQILFFYFNLSFSLQVLHRN